MRKIVILFLICLIPSFAFAAGVSYKVQNTQKGVHAPKGNSYYKSILHTNEGIKGNYDVMKSQNSTGLIKQTTLTNTSNSNSIPAIPLEPAKPNYRPTSKYLPALYTYGFSSANDDKQEINVQNNTYNYYGSQPSSAVNQQQAKSEKEKNQSNKSDIEQERAMLKSKYANILSNKTMSNEKMCAKMESYYKNADYYELDRVLNTVLKLNCDIDKLRPNGVIK